MILKECIKKARERAKMTQEEASVILEVSPQTIANWEAGRAKPDSSIYNKIAKTYNIDVIELIDALAFEIQSENQENILRNKELKFVDLLPENSNLEKVKDFEFSELEQKAFLILASYAEFNTSPIEKLISLSDNIFNIISVLDKLRKYNLYYSRYNPLVSRDYGYQYDFKLSREGKEVFKIIKHNRNRLFSIYNLSFIDFLNLIEVYKIIDKEKIEKTIEIMDIIGNGGLLLETYSYSEETNIWTKRYLTKNMEWTEYNNYIHYEQTIEEFLEPDLYEIVELELEDELYCIEKEAYTKKMEFYNQNKEKFEELKEPKEFKELFFKKVVLTPKGVKFIDEIHKSYNN